MTPQILGEPIIKHSTAAANFVLKCKLRGDENLNMETKKLHSSLCIDHEM